VPSIPAAPPSWKVPVLWAGACLLGQWAYDGWQRREPPISNSLQWCILSDPPAEVYRITQTPSGQQRLRLGRTGEVWEVPVRAADLYFSLEAWGHQPLRVYRPAMAGSRRYPPQGRLQLQPLHAFVPLVTHPGYPLAVLAGLFGLWRWRGQRRWLSHQLRLQAAWAQNQVEPGMQIGPYQVVGLLGRGGMAAVYEVTTESGESRALKLLNPGLDQESRQRFEHEVRLSLPLRHPHLLAFYDFGEFEGRFYLVMERLTGEHLNRAWRPRPLGQRLNWLKQVAMALQKLHDLGILHRDLKPGNVMVCGSKVVLMDFGIARDMQAEAISMAGQVLGTPGYMAPEQLMGKSLGPACDLYALGMMIYEACTDRLAFEAETDLDLLRRQVTQEPEPLQKHRPDLPEDFCQWVMGLLARNPGERPETAREVEERLQFWSQSL